MSHYEVLGSAQVDAPLDADGHPFHLMKDGVKVFGGTSSDCMDQAYFLGKDGEDTITCGVGQYENAKIEDVRTWHFDAATHCGFILDQYGRINGRINPNEKE